MKIEIKEIKPVSAFKTILYFSIIPFALIFAIGLLLTVIGAVISGTELLFIGIPYMIMPFFMIGIYGALGMLVSVIYNALSKKFGGLELTVEQKEEKPNPYANPVNYYNQNQNQNYNQNYNHNQNHNPNHHQE